jgi:hypothetical protein
MSTINRIRKRLTVLPPHLHRLLPVWAAVGALAWLAPKMLVEWLGVFAQPWFWWLLMPAVLLLAARVAPAPQPPAIQRSRNATAVRRRRPRPPEVLARAA